MIVKELIEILQQYPEDIAVELVGNYDSVELVAKDIYFNDSKKPFQKDEDAVPVVYIEVDSYVFLCGDCQDY